MGKGPKLFTCPQCRHTYLGHDPVPDCPRCGHDYRAKATFRWDILAYLVVIMALLSFFLMSSFYRDMVHMPPLSDQGRADYEKLPGARDLPFRSPYDGRGR
ncbi:hypothetical protein [Candidatus Nitrospira bockiana]